MKKRYHVVVENADGTKTVFWAYDLAAAEECAAEYPRARVFAVYKRARSHVYMDEDEYAVEVKRDGNPRG